MRTFLLCHFKGFHGIVRFSGLADNDNKRVFRYQRITIAEFGSQDREHQLVCKTFQRVLCHHTDVVGRSAGNDIKNIRILNLFRSKLQVTEINPAVFYPGRNGFVDCFRLFHDFLEHEMRIAALFRRGNIPVDGMKLLFYRLTKDIKNLDRLRRNHGHFPVFHICDLPGMRNKSRCVGCNQVESVPVAQEQRRVLSCGDDGVRIISAENDHGISPFNAMQRMEHGL